MDLNIYSIDELMRKRRGLRRQLLLTPDLRDLRIAVLGGSTTNELVDLWELMLLAEGFRPVFHQTEYGRYYSDAVHSPEDLIAFAPDLIYVHTNVRNIERYPPLQATDEDLAYAVASELNRFRQIWSSLADRIGCQIIQNNFELPQPAPLGNLDAMHPGGRSRFVSELNLAFAREAAADPRLILQDIHGISANMGLSQWVDHDRWFGYKIPVTVEANLALARSLTALVRAIYGRSRKCLVLDMDNTLWGGVIGDDGVDKIQIGRETPVAEAYTAFQEYCLAQRDRGILLAVCSKNDAEVARAGLLHPDSILKLEHFSAFRANWEPKHDNIADIARELNIGIDSLVFVDDNPAERAIVSAQLPGVAVPNVGAEVTRFVPILEAERYFEAISLANEDLLRARTYQENAQRSLLEQKFENYGQYLDSLQMIAEIDTFRPVYIDRITQLTNKTNQFNLTTRRYTLAEMEAVMADPASIGLYGRLVDSFGDNGLVSVVLGRQQDTQLHIDLWLMSCRVLKRDMEIAMLDELVAAASHAGIQSLVGTYTPTKKNSMVSDLYGKLGFAKASEDADTGTTTWHLEVSAYKQQGTHIRITSNAGVPRK